MKSPVWVKPEEATDTSQRVQQESEVYSKPACLLQPKRRGQIFLSENWAVASASLVGGHIRLWFVQDLAANESHLQRPSGMY